MSGLIDASSVIQDEVKTRKTLLRFSVQSKEDGEQQMTVIRELESMVERLQALAKE